MLKPYYQELLKQTGKNIFTTAPTVTDPRTGKVISGGEVTGIKEMPTYTGERVAGFTPQQHSSPTRSFRIKNTTRVWPSTTQV
jgi:hypothetical protein